MEFVASRSGSAGPQARQSSPNGQSFRLFLVNRVFRITSRKVRALPLFTDIQILFVFAISMNSIRILICAIFAIALIAAPWPIGGNWPFTRTWLLGFALVGLVLALIDKDSKRPIARFPWAWLALALGAGYIFFQSTSASAQLNQMHGGPRPFQQTTEQTTDDLGTISIYPAATRGKLVDVLIGVGFFFASTVLLRERSTITAVLTAAVIVGTAMSFFGVVQNLSWNGKIFWQYELLHGGIPFGSFVNKNNAAGFLLATFSAAMFFVAQQLFAWNKKHRPQGLILAEDHWQGDSNSRNSFASTAIEMFAELGPKQLYCYAAVAIIFAGVLATLSRGGMVALAATCLVAFAVLSRTNKWVVTLATIGLLALGIGFVIYSEQSSDISEKLETLSSLDNAAAPRMLHWQDALPFANQHLLLGCGAGTYRYASNSFQTFFFQKTYAHAENVYLETLIEMGVGAVVLLLFVIAYCFYCSIKLIRRNETFDQALGVVGLSCLVGQTIASAMDFGIYQPANTTIVAVIMGCVIGRAATDIVNSSLSSTKGSGLLPNISIKLALVAALASCAWGTYESYAIESVQRAKRTIGLIKKYKRPHNRLTSNRSLERINEQLEHAISVRPDDMEAHYQMGEYNITRYRAEAASELLERAMAGFKAVPNRSLTETELDALWAMTAPTAIHRQLRFAQRNNKELVQTITNDSRINQYFPSAWESFTAAEKNSPYLAKTQYRLAELSAFFDHGAEESHIDSALSRTLSNTRLMFSCGLLALNSGNQEKAVELWSKCLANPNSRHYVRPIVEISQAELPMNLFFEKVLPQDPAKLIDVAQQFFHRADLMLPKRLLLVHTKRVIAQTELSELDRLFLSAEACRLSEEFEPAAELYRKALELNPSQVLWRFNYAKCLHKSKQFDEAIRQLKICELEPSKIHRNIKPLLNLIRRDRAKVD